MGNCTSHSSTCVCDGCKKQLQDNYIETTRAALFVQACLRGHIEAYRNRFGDKELERFRVENKISTVAAFPSDYELTPEAKEQMLRVVMTNQRSFLKFSSYTLPQAAQSVPGQNVTPGGPQ